jgi:hypothetical protein
LEYSLEVEHLLSMHEALGSFYSTHAKKASKKQMYVSN